MSKFTFICEEEPMPFADTNTSKRTVEFEGVTLDSIVEEFELFLRGCGFYLNGKLDIVSEEEHSKYFYDTDRNK